MKKSTKELPTGTLKESHTINCFFSEAVLTMKFFSVFILLLSILLVHAAPDKPWTTPGSRKFQVNADALLCRASPSNIPATTRVVRKYYRKQKVWAICRKLFWENR
jgi:hypothetical protein